MMNTTGEPLSGSITVTTPTGESVTAPLDERGHVELQPPIDHRWMRGPVLTVAWLDQIRERTNVEPTPQKVEYVSTLCFRNRPCNDCGAKIGQAHNHGCDVERCTHTGMQWIACGGMSEWHDCDCQGPDGFEPDYADQHTCGQVPHDCGSEIWDGVWPGYPECIEYGWYCYFDEGWHRCDAAHPKAMPDLNRLHVECRWDRARRAWVRHWEE